MTLNELKGKYARLSDEIDTLAAEGVHHEARLMRLMNDLDQVHHELCKLRRFTFAAPTLRDVVTGPGPVAPRAVVVPMAASVVVPQLAPVMPAPALSMAG